MPEIKRPSGWDRLQGLFFGVTVCGLMWALFSYILPLVVGSTGQGWAAPGTGAWGGLALLALGVVGLAVVAIIRPKRGDPKQE
jgi:hypothetical protein